MSVTRDHGSQRSSVAQHGLNPVWDPTLIVLHGPGPCIPNKKQRARLRRHLSRLYSALSLAFGPRMHIKCSSADGRCLHLAIFLVRYYFSQQLLSQVHTIHPATRIPPTNLNTTIKRARSWHRRPNPKRRTHGSPPCRTLLPKPSSVQPVEDTIPLLPQFPTIPPSCLPQFSSSVPSPTTRVPILRVEEVCTKWRSRTRPVGGGRARFSKCTMSRPSPSSS